MDNSNVFVRGDHQVNEEKPPPRVCPRCNSDNTKFCYYNNYSLSQPRYTCKNCRRYWTHGGALRNIPVGGSGRKTKRPKIDQSSVSQVVSVETQQINHHQPFLNVQETNEFLGSFGGSSSFAAGNHFGSLSETIPPMDRFDLSNGSFHQGYYDVESNNLLSNPLVNQSIGGHVNNYNNYRVNQEDQNKRKQSFNNSMNMNHNVSTSGSNGYPGTDHMIYNNSNKVRNNYV